MTNPQRTGAGDPSRPLLLPLVLIKGAGDLASGVALRLHHSGFPVVMTELARPLAVRRMASFAQAVFDGSVVVEDVRGVCCEPSAAADCLAGGEIAVLIDPYTQALHGLRPAVFVDAVMAKRNTGTRRYDAPLVIALGPGFRAGEDCHAVIETNRGHDLGRVIRRGRGRGGYGQPRRACRAQGPMLCRHTCCRAAIDGFVVSSFRIGDRVEQGATIAEVQGTDGTRAPLVAAFSGILRGLIHASVPVTAGLKIGDLTRAPSQPTASPPPTKRGPSAAACSRRSSPPSPTRPNTS